MTLTDPREALAEQSTFVGYLVGLAGLARLVHALADEPRPHRTPDAADEFTYLLLGFASLGAAVERLAAPAALPSDTAPRVTTQTRWLR